MPPPAPRRSASASPDDGGAPAGDQRPRGRKPRRRRRTALVAGATALVLAAGGAVALLVRSPDDGGGARVTASDDSLVSDPADLVSGAGSGAAWAAGEDPVGAWVQVEWPQPVSVDRVRLVAAEGSPAVTSGLLVLDGGAGVMVTAGAEGGAEASFPQREVSSARFTVASGDPGAALAGLVLDDGGSVPSSTDAAGPLADATATASTSADGTEAGAVVDGALADQDTGEEWRAQPSDADPWVELSWPEPRLVTAVQVFGPREETFDPGASGASPLSGRLEFSDGSAVVVSGVDGGDGQPTTVAVAPRTATSVRVRLTPNTDAALVALREVAVYAAGSTPVRWETTGTGYEVEPPAASCGGAPVGSADGGALALVCPAVGSAVSGTAEVVVQGQPGAAVTASTASSDGGARVVATATAGDDGRATLGVDTSALSPGPFALEVTQDAGDAAPLHLQLVAGDGSGAGDAEVPGHAPAGMTLQWEDAFDGPLPVSGTGEGAVYAAGKPENWGTSQFGDAVFADPATGAGTVATIPGGFLRLRAEPVADLDVETPYDQEHVGGLLSSARVGAGGFSAQYGYFEARMLAGAGEGTWPAFWMLNSQAATTDNATAGEVDAVELYGHDTSFTCHTLHDWGASDDDGSTGSTCLEPEVTDDWALGWHVYGVRVTPDGAEFSIDGAPVTQDRGLGRSDEPFFFLVDMALGGGWPVGLEPTGGTSDLYVDWVRAYT